MRRVSGFRPTTKSRSLDLLEDLLLVIVWGMRFSVPGFSADTSLRFGNPPFAESAAASTISVSCCCSIDLQVMSCSLMPLLLLLLLSCGISTVLMFLSLGFGVGAAAFSWGFCNED